MLLTHSLKHWQGEKYATLVIFQYPGTDVEVRKIVGARGHFLGARGSGLISWSAVGRCLHGQWWID